MRSAYKFRIYPNQKQVAELEDTLEICRNLWDTALADRKAAWEKRGETRSYPSFRTNGLISKHFPS
ncbi:helix-turn-helix domain-containing protein [Candidatus Methanocrinis natronophilus]|uniref:helix-turn-helix domain-containing protein n=1 Tax=Candidatus Methanocrinis natronophilus TaxID=3033396 RepID=UPI003742B5FC